MIYIKKNLKKKEMSDFKAFNMIYFVPVSLVHKEKCEKGRFPQTTLIRKKRSFLAMLAAEWFLLLLKHNY